MKNAIRYLNTDLDLTSSHDLAALAASFKTHGLQSLHVTRGADGLWYATFEDSKQDDQPEPSIAAMLAAIEALAEPLREVWSGCMLREFNLGYDCGARPWAFNQGLSRQLLGRMAAAGASLRITLYPPERERTAEPRAAPDPDTR